LDETPEIPAIEFAGTNPAGAQRFRRTRTMDGLLKLRRDFAERFSAREIFLETAGIHSSGVARQPSEGQRRRKGPSARVPPTTST
jgi:hypothetical protein